MNWFFKLVFLGILWSTVLVEEVISSESLFFPNLRVIESFFKSSFENASYRKSFDSGRLRLKGDEGRPQDILSYRQHGFHPANAESWKLQCVWNAMNTVARHLPQIVSSNNQSRVKVDLRELCSSHAWENCGLDLNKITCDPNLEYRSINGTCNNLNNTRWGSALQPFERFVHSDYGNGVSSFRLSENGKKLPNPRKISRALSSSKPGAQPEVTLMLMSWGQFIDHDITLTPEREIGNKLTGCVGGEIVAGQCLTFSNEKLSWNDAKLKCASQNGRLAVLNDPQAFMTFVATTDIYKHTGFWLGASDIANEGSWVWLDGRPLGDQFPWHSGEPNAAFENEDCILTSSDAPCHYLERYVCEKDPFEGSSTMECCNNGLYENSVHLWDDCVPINVTGDPFYAQNNTQCIRFVRSMPALRGCDLSPMEQINRNTAFIDGSMVYGSDAEVAKFVRTGENGLLNTTMHVGNDQPLPPRGGDGFAHQCPQRESMDTCFLAGDVRVDEIPGLTAMHTTFIRLHNIIAEDLCKLNPGWCDNDEKLFQETRRIVIALIQQITYRDWLPHVVGPTLMEENNLDVGSQGYRDTYDPNVNPTIRNVFATAALRFGHTLIADVIKAAKKENNLKVQGNFFNIHVIGNITTSPSSLLKGLTRCPSAPIDVIVEPHFTNSLFAEEPADDGNFYGLDLVSLNIQRGRDHGIPGYRAWRTFCGLDDVNNFNKLKKVMSHDLVKAFKNIYSKVGDIDLFPAGLAENSIDDGILGPTFSCIIARQLANIKHGDRFWYEREDQPKPFTPDQLSSIRSQTLVSILCRVSEHTSLGFQPNPFLVESKTNAAIDCSSYNFINLQPWKEPQKDAGVLIGGQYLKFSTEKVSWLLANERCKSQNAKLAVLNNPQAFHTYVASNYRDERFWLGGSDRDNEGSWTWINGQSFSSFPWGPAQPDNNQNNEHCLEWGWQNNYNDEPCPNAQRYVCENVVDCLDTNLDCQYWADIGECEKNPAYMLSSCPKACGTCGVGPPPPITLADCTGLWFPLGNQCFRVISELRTWRSARDNCNLQIADLAQPNDIKTLNDYLKENDDARRWNYWLGASDSATEGEWLWLNGSILNNQHPGWGLANPDDGGSSVSSQDCLSMRPGHGARSLDDDGCDASRYSICERPIRDIDACSEEEGFFKVPESVNQCFKLFTDSGRSWEASKLKCEAEGLLLAKPADPVKLRKYIAEAFGGDKLAWLGARGTGSEIEWDRDGTPVSRSNPFWYPGEPHHKHFTTEWCMPLLSNTVNLDREPLKPLNMNPCEWAGAYALCELVE